jgi:hypothetical protein
MQIVAKIFFAMPSCRIYLEARAGYPRLTIQYLCPVVEIASRSHIKRPTTAKFSKLPRPASPFVKPIAAALHLSLDVLGIIV